LNNTISPFDNGSVKLFISVEGNSSYYLSFNETLTDAKYIPYTGAIANVDLGVYNLTTTGDISCSDLDVTGLTAGSVLFLMELL